MNPVLLLHIAAGLVALAAGAAAAAVRKGGGLHARAGTAFMVSMLMLGVTASTLKLLAGQPGFNGLFVVYFVVTAWSAARLRESRGGRLELAAGLGAIAFAALTVYGGLAGTSTTPLGQAPVFAAAALCALAGALDLSTLRRRMSGLQRISRHLWRVSFGFFIATGSFFLGEQDVLPAALRGSALLWLVALSPFALMAFWLVRLRLPQRFRGELSGEPFAPHLGSSTNLRP
jgi:hypothetical protein